MSQFILKIDTDNAAFEDDPDELPRLIREVANEIADGYIRGPVRDINGNKVGTFSLR